MSEIANRYNKAYTAMCKYRDAPRRGWAEPNGRKTADNQTIEVRRDEVVELARRLSSQEYANACLLYEVMELSNYMGQLAVGEPNGAECENCYNRYLPSWLDGKCPYCSAHTKAEERVRKILKEAEETRSSCINGDKT
jgi:hypothetical protein